MPPDQDENRWPLAILVFFIVILFCAAGYVIGALSVPVDEPGIVLIPPTSMAVRPSGG